MEEPRPTRPLAALSSFLFVCFGGYKVGYFIIFFNLVCQHLPSSGRLTCPHHTSGHKGFVASVPHARPRGGGGGGPGTPEPPAAKPGVGPGTHGLGRQGWGTMLHLRDLTAGSSRSSRSTGRICLSLERDDPPSADSPRMPPPCWRLSSACGLPGNSTDGRLEPLWILLTPWHLFLHRF
nr:uncharacterized protein LOC112926298 isoform X2 [Vulpes vulpes]